jgi:hypothetical protein
LPEVDEFIEKLRDIHASTNARNGWALTITKPEMT